MNNTSISIVIVNFLLSLSTSNIMENMFGFAGPGHYNEVASLLRWPLSEVSLYKEYLLELIVNSLASSSALKAVPPSAIVRRVSLM